MPIMPDIRNIDTQRAIADAYIANGGNGEKAVTAAGYAEKYARSHAYRLIARPEVRQMIRERGDAIAGQRLAGMEEINAFWTAVMRDEGRDIKDRLKASELRAKAAGGFLDKVSLTGPAPVVICGGDDLAVASTSPTWWGEATAISGAAGNATGCSRGARAARNPPPPP